MYNYPVSAPSDALSAEQVQLILSKPALLARRLDSILNKAFISDLLLTQPYDVTGAGAALVEGEDGLYPDREAEEIQAGAEYPLTPLAMGLPQLVRNVKRGQDTEVFDEAIARTPTNILDRALAKLGNGLVRTIDTLSLAAIASKVTQTYAASGAWTDGARIVGDVMGAVATIDEQELGYSIDTVVLKPTQYAKVVANLLNANLMPRENNNPLMSNAAASFNYMGLTWAKSIHVPGTDPMLVDTQQLGGMLKEDIKSPGYATYGVKGIETKSQRLVGGDDRDGWRLRARRLTSPVIVAPKAAVRLTGTSL